MSPAEQCDDNGGARSAGAAGERQSAVLSISHFQLERLRRVPTPDHSQLMRVGRAAPPTSDAP